MNKNISYEQAEILYENKKFVQALEMFKELETAETDPYIQNYIGCCLLKLRQYSEAQQIFEVLVFENNDWARPVYNLGRVYMEQNMLENALMCFDKALSIDPYDADSYYYRGVYFEKTEDSDNTILNYKIAVSFKPDEFEFHVGLCNCYDYIGDVHNALTEARKAFELFDCNDTLYNYTYLLNKTHNFEQVYDLLQSHDVIAYDDVGLLKNFMFCLKKLKKNSLCLKCAKIILEKTPEDCFAISIVDQLSGQSASND